MTQSASNEAAGQETARQLFVYNGGILTQKRVRRILHLSGWQVRLGRPGPDDRIGVWGHSPTAHRGEGVAARLGVPLLRIEDAFLRSLHPGRAGEPPLGLLLDQRGAYFDSSHPSDLETILARDPLDDTALLDRARACTAWMRRAHLTKYAAVDPGQSPPEPGYVLVIDQTRGDASIRLGGGSEAMFAEMLAVARIEHPGHRIIIKTHPETAGGHRPGHYGPASCDARTSLLTDSISPWALLEGAVAVYSVTSQMGFEAILAGHKPRIFGQPFYGGWGLSQDENPVPRRERVLTRAQLFAGAMLLYPTWYDPCHDRLCPLEDVIALLEAQARAWREDRHGHVASGMRLWKRAPLQRFYGRHRRLRFRDDPARASSEAARRGCPLMVWASKEVPEHRADHLLRVEDGFLRSRGLGAELVPPHSLVSDAQGIYYDPLRPSDLEGLIAASVHLPPDQIMRSERLIGAIKRLKLTKYNISAHPLPDLPDGWRILVPGQVEDDASITKGSPITTRNVDLLARTREANPTAVILYKPHPDVEAGLRQGAVPREEALHYADMVLDRGAMGPLLGLIDEVWTMTSLTGFEALLRDKPVTCLGAPFYAGWGLTRDLGPIPERRRARPSLAQLVHATLIGYPRYLDPVTGLPCPPEVTVTRLASGTDTPRGPTNRALSKLQGLFSSAAHLWR